MNSEAGLSNFVRSGKWQTFGDNTFAPFECGETFWVPRSSLQQPSGFIIGGIKGMLGRRVYVP